MNTQIQGSVYVLGPDIDTDQIIPAKFLSYNPSLPEERKFFGKYALAGVPEGQQGLPAGDIPFIKGGFSSEYAIVVGDKNFGCGSSREHAPLALAEAGVKIVIANSFARIFYRNSINGGYIVPVETDAPLAQILKTRQTVTVDLDSLKLTIAESGQSYDLKPLGDVLKILEAGDIFTYAKIAGITT